MFGGRNAFDSAARLAGGKLVVARTLEELQSAIGPNTAMIYTTALGDRLERAIAIAKRGNVPLLLDDAAGIPPIGNLRLYAKMGVDLFCFSGGTTGLKKFRASSASFRRYSQALPWNRSVPVFVWTKT